MELEKIRKEGKITVGVKVDSKPFGYEQNGELKGFDVDLAITTNELVKFLKVKSICHIFVKYSIFL